MPSTAHKFMYNFNIFLDMELPMKINNLTNPEHDVSFDDRYQQKLAAV